MYSPKISEDLIPIIYRQSKLKAKTMTKFVDEILRPRLIKNDKEKENGRLNDNEIRENDDEIMVNDISKDEERYCCSCCRMEVEKTESEKGYCDSCECEVFIEKI